MVQQIVEARASFGIHGHDFAVQYHRPVELAQGTRERNESPVDVTLPRDKKAAAVVNIGDASKSVLLQFEDEMWVIERRSEKCRSCERKVLLVQLTFIVPKLPAL
jgi:hypothetical protein